MKFRASPEAKQFRRATIYARIVRISLVALIFSFIMFMLFGVAGPPNILESVLQWVPLLTVLVSFLALVISSLGTASTIMLGWRSERRQAEESRLKIEQLELQLADVRAKAAVPREQT
jgi:hypothetical protein